METELVWKDGAPGFALGGLAPTPAEVEKLEKLNYRLEAGGWYVKWFGPGARDIPRIYANFARCAEEMVLQKFGQRPVPWESAMLGLLQALEGAPVDWFLGGSTALAVRGVAVAPGDVDLIVLDGAEALGEALRDWLVEPFQETPDWVCAQFGRAFWQARIEWVIAPTAAADLPEPSDFGMYAAERLEEVVWQGHRLRVPPLALQAAVTRRRGLEERMAAIEAFLGSETTSIRK